MAWDRAHAADREKAIGSIILYISQNGWAFVMAIGLF